MPEFDGLYEKYRVFKEPWQASSHPVKVRAHWEEDALAEPYPVLEEVTSFVFVLKPDTDPAARVALAAYAEAIKPTHPRLTEDLRDVLAGIDA